MKRIVVNEHGGPETLTLVDGPMPEPGPKEALVAISGQRRQLHRRLLPDGPLSELERPTAIGSEGAGTVERVGSEVTEVSLGDRVVYAMARGSYAEHAVVPAALLAPIPDDVTFEAAAAVMLQGHDGTLTSHAIDVSSRQHAHYLPRPRRGRRPRHAARADGKGARRAGHWNRLDGRKAHASSGTSVLTRPSSTPSRISRPK